MSLVPKIKIQFSFLRLAAINTAWNFIDEFPVKNTHDKAMLSLIQKIAVKFQKKQISLQYSNWEGKAYNKSLDYDEAYFLEIFFRKIYNLYEFGYERNVIQNMSDILNQKLA